VSISVVKCGVVLKCRDGLSNKAANIIRRHIDNMKLLLVCILLLSHSFYFFVNEYMVIFLFSTGIYVLLCLCILIVCFCIFIVPAGTVRLP
jgi:hypothetical protein